MTDAPKRRRRKGPKTPLTETEVISRGMRAQSEMQRTENAFMAVREDLLEAIASSTPSEAEGRERLYMAIWALGRVRDLLIEEVNGGVMADAQQKAVAALAAGLPN